MTNKNSNGGGPWGKEPWGKEPSSKGPNHPRDDEFDDLIKKGQDKIRELFPNGGGGGKNGGNIRLFSLLAILAVFFWLASGFYTVNTKEEGIVLRFGEYIRTASSGLNYHLPSPIEQVIKLRVTDRYKEEVGYRTEKSSRRFKGDSRNTDSRGGEILMLTGDENIVDISFEVQWQIADSRKFLFNIKDPIKTVRDAAESSMREVIGTTPINETLSDGRTAVQLQVKQSLQAILDSYDAGIRIETINMKGVPPGSVDEAFKDVQAAKINKEETINKAIAYRNEVLPKAEGQANRFMQVYNEYKVAKEVTRKRMYLETMENIMHDMEKVILSTEGGQVMPYLPLNELRKSSNIKKVQ